MIKILPAQLVHLPSLCQFPALLVHVAEPVQWNQCSDIRVRGDHRWNRPAHTQLPAFLATHRGLTCQKALSKGSDGFGIR